MSENDLTIRLKALNGQWETAGADRLRGIVPESFQATANEWGSDTCSFVLRRTTGAVHPDLTAFTPCRVEVAGVKVWSGRVKETPTQDGTDEAISVQGEGMQYHLDDDIYTRMYVHARLADWQDVRQNVLAYLPSFTATPQVNGSTLQWSNGTTVTINECVGLLLDCGSDSAGWAKRISVDWTPFASANASIIARCADSPAMFTAGGGGVSGTTYDTAFQTVLGGVPVTQSGTFANPRRYVAVFLFRTGATAATTSDYGITVNGIRLYTDAAYETADASTLTADDIVHDAITQATMLLSTDRSQVQAGTFVIDEYAPSGARSPREAISSINAAYENYETKVDVEDRICFRPRPVSPMYEIGEWSGADFSDASTNSGEDIFNRVLVQGTGPDGNQLSVDRSAADQLGATLVPIASPAATNPSFAVDTSGWSGAGGTMTLSRTTVAGEFDTSPAAMKVVVSALGGTVTGTTTGTFLKGTRYTLRFRIRADPATLSKVIARLGEGTDAAMTFAFAPTPATYADASVTWTPTADRSSATIQLSFLSGFAVTGDYFFDTFALFTTSPTLVDRRNFRRAKILPISSSITTAVATRIADLFLAAHKTTPFRGGFKTTGRGGVRRILGGGSVHPAWLLRDTGQLVRCAHRADPDTGAWTRSGRMATVSYDHDSLTATVALDEDREGFEVLLQRYALVNSRGPGQ